MIVIKDKVENKIEYPLERLGNVDHMIYFDIETTGFSRKYCMVYMIGCMYFVNSEPIYTQWVAEKGSLRFIPRKSSYVFCLLFSNLSKSEYFFTVL